MDTEQSIQAYLDSLSQLPGTILYRDQLEWKALPPGQEGSILTLGDDGLPAWDSPHVYWPAMMYLNGSSMYWSKTGLTVPNAPFTLLSRFRTTSVSTSQTLIHIIAATRTVIRLYVDNTNRLQAIARDTANNVILRCRSTINVADGVRKYSKLEFNAATGAVSLIIDGNDCLDTAWASHVATTGTRPSGTGATCHVGRQSTAIEYWRDEIGATGVHFATGFDWNEFMWPDGHPKEIDRITWDQFGSQPWVWNENGDLENNRGSTGLFTRTGSIAVALPERWS